MPDFAPTMYNAAMLPPAGQQPPPPPVPVQPPAPGPQPFTGFPTPDWAQKGITPPAWLSGGAPMPNVQDIYDQAYSSLPIDEAGKAVEAALKYQGMRGYQQDLNDGMEAPKALAKWMPMMSGASASTMQKMMPKPLPQTTPYQQAEIQLRREAAAKPRKAATISIPIDPDNPDGPKITGPADDPDVMEARDNYKKAMAPKPPKPKEPGFVSKMVQKVFGDGTTPNPAQAGVQAPVNPDQPAADAPAAKPLTKAVAIQFMQQAGGDKKKARKLAKDAGYEF